MNYLIQYVIMGIATALTALWVVLFLRYNNKFDDVLAAIDPKQYMIPELFFIGFGFMDMFKVDMRSEYGRKKEKRIAEVYGDKYAPFYHYCTLGGQITYALTITPLGLALAAMSGQPVMALVAIAAMVALVVYLDLDINSAIEKKRDLILSDYPEMLSKLVLLVNAGMVIRDAISNVAYTADRPLYKELQTMSEEMRNNVSDIDALYNLAQRCGVAEIRKFASVVSQNIQKGGGQELVMNLRFMNEESWEEKKHRAKRKGETAGSKLMIPMMIMFAGILIMIVVPVFTNML